MNLARPRSSSLVSVAFVVGSVAAFACTDRIDILNLPCPCADTSECCGGICVDVGTCAQETKVDREVEPRSDAIALVAEQSAQCMTQDSTHLYWMTINGVIAAAEKRPHNRPALSTVDIPNQTIERCSLVMDRDVLYAPLFGSGTIARLLIRSGANEESGRFSTDVRTFGAFVTPSGIAVDDAYIYVAEYDSGQIKRLPKPGPPDVGDAGAGDGGLAPDASDGGGDAVEADAPPTLLGQGGLNARNLIADATSLYWVDDRGVRKMSKKGGAIATLTGGTIGKVVLVNDSLFFRGPGRSLLELRTEGGVARTIRLDDPDQKPLEGDDTSEEDLRTLDAFATDGRAIFFSSEGALWRGSVSGEPVTRLFTYVDEDGVGRQAGNAGALLMDETSVYWTDQTSIWRHPR